MSLFGQHDQDYKGSETFEEAKQRRREEKKTKHLEGLKRGLVEYNPNEDTQVRGDPYKTLFISRLSYEVTEDDLQREFGRYGPIERVRIVKSKDDKPRGYAFLVFEREKDMKAAYKDTDGMRIKEKRILVDVERGRTVKNWKPTRLGGGLGGRQKPGKSSLRNDNYSSGYSAGPPRGYNERGPSRPVNGYGGGRDEPRDRSGSRPDRGDMGHSGQSSRPYEPPAYNDRNADRSRLGRSGIGFDRPPDMRTGPPRSYQDSHIAFQPSSQPALDPRARQPPTTYGNSNPPASAAPSAPWLANSASSGGRDRPSYDDDRDYKRRRY